MCNILYVLKAFCFGHGLQAATRKKQLTVDKSIGARADQSLIGTQCSGRRVTCLTARCNNLFFETNLSKCKYERLDKISITCNYVAGAHLTMGVAMHMTLIHPHCSLFCVNIQAILIPSQSLWTKKAVEMICLWENEIGTLQRCNLTVAKH